MFTRVQWIAWTFNPIWHRGGGDIFISLSSLDQILSADFCFIKFPNILEVKIDINRIISTLCPVYWIFYKLPLYMNYFTSTVITLLKYFCTHILTKYFLMNDLIKTLFQFPKHTNYLVEAAYFSNYLCRKAYFVRDYLAAYKVLK